MTSTSPLANIQLVGEFFDLAHRFEPIQGFLPAEQGFALHQLAAHGEGRGQIVEIGSFMGRSTCWLAQGSKLTKREKVTAVDHFRGSPEHQQDGAVPVSDLRDNGSTLPRFRTNLMSAELDDHVNVVVADSVSAAKQWNSGAIRLLFIDGDHSYQCSKDDFDSWSPFICPRGYICFHDIGPFDGVTRFYSELMASTKTYKEIAAVGSLRIVQRVR